jgi:hypothetical protein
MRNEQHQCATNNSTNVKRVAQKEPQKKDNTKRTQPMWEEQHDKKYKQEKKEAQVLLVIFPLPPLRP